MVNKVTFVGFRGGRSPQSPLSVAGVGIHMSVILHKALMYWGQCSFSENFTLLA